VSPAGPAEAPAVTLGATAQNGIAASIYALVERGVSRHPHLAGEVRGEVELRFEEDFAPVRLSFSDRGVLVEDGSPPRSDLVITGRLPHIVALSTAPLMGGVPSLAARRGRAALAQVANRRVRIRGNRALGRKLLRLLEL
jgi:hypothetical protein